MCVCVHVCVCVCVCVCGVCVCVCVCVVCVCVCVCVCVMIVVYHSLLHHTFFPPPHAHTHMHVLPTHTTHTTYTPPTPQGSLREFSQLIGFEAYSRFGYAMAALGDVSGDGLDGTLHLPWASIPRKHSHKSQSHINIKCVE